MTTTILSFDIGVKNLAYCYFQYTSLSKQFNLNDIELDVFDWNVIDLDELMASSKTKPSLNDRCNVLLKELNVNFSLVDVDYVLIENQPVLKNPIMKSIQMIVYTFFKNLQINECKMIIDVQMINASNKVRYAVNVLSKHFKVECIESSEKKTYKMNKDIVVSCTKQLLSYKEMHNPLTFFNGFKKKDDLADTLLQGLYFCHKHLHS